MLSSTSRAIRYRAAPLLVAALGLLAPVGVRAETLTLACLEDVIKAGMPAPPAAQTIVVSMDKPQTVEVKAPYGTLKLPANIRKNEVAMQVSATGPGKAIMPAKKDVDACLAKGKAPAPGEELNVWAAQTCRLGASLTPEPVPVDVSIEITILEGDVTTTVQRNYAGDDNASADRYGMPSRPQCKVESRK